MSYSMIDVSIGEFCPFVYGKALKAEDRKNGKIPVYGSNGIVGFHNEYLVNGPGIIIGRKGSVGELHLSEEPFWVIDTAFYISGYSINELRYIYYQLKTLNLDKMNSDSAVPGLNRENAHSRIITIPKDSKIREKIGNEISKYDYKLKCNNDINQTLESISQTLFKSWFVDFDPVKAKIAAKKHGNDPQLAAMMAISGKSEDEINQMPADKRKQLVETADLFPDEMMDSELGEIPKGWEATNFGNVTICFDSKRIPLSNRERLKIKGNYPYYGATSIMDYIDKYIFDGTYLLLGEDGSVINDLGLPFTQYVWGKFWVNNHAHVLQGRNSVSTEQLYIFISQTNISEFITGAVQLKLNQGNMNRIPFVLAEVAVNKSFTKLIGGLMTMYKTLSEQNKRLSVLRDTLLTKLLKGDVKV